MTRTQVLSYGGGRQTVAMVALVVSGVLPRPERIVIADTGREKTSTWDYLSTVIQPLLAQHGMCVEIAPRSLSYTDLYAKNGDLLIPAYTRTGKLSAFCSSEWKQRVVARYMRGLGVQQYDSWIGFALDERKRVKSTAGRVFPLLDLSLTKRDCIDIVGRAGLPLPVASACYMCPNLHNEEWRQVRDNYPADFEAACLLDENIREQDLFTGGTGLWLHHSRVPLREVDLSTVDRQETSSQCGLGMCFV